MWKAVRVKWKMQWRSQKVADARNMGLLPWATSKSIPRERLCGLQLERPEEWGCQSL
jgi:hypothetical protein